MRCAKQTELLRLFIPSQFEGKGSNVTLDTIPPDLFPPPSLFYPLFLFFSSHSSNVFCLCLPIRLFRVAEKNPRNRRGVVHALHMSVIFIMDNNLVRLGVSIFWRIDNNCPVPSYLFVLFFRTNFVIYFLFFFYILSRRILRRGSMFVISDRQFRRLFHLADDYRAERMLDLGAGDGATTALLSGMFDNVHVTEMSWPMKRILAARGFA